MLPEEEREREREREREDLLLEVYLFLIFSFLEETSIQNVCSQLP